jgi:hypothetical protein
LIPLMLPARWSRALRGHWRNEGTNCGGTIRRPRRDIPHLRGLQCLARAAEVAMPEDPLSWLQDWYVAQCDGDWEHEWGVKIGTFDNPGWSLEVDLTNTPLEDVAFTKIDVERSDHDWLFCEVVDNKFKAACGPRNLAEAIEQFRA